MRDFDQQRDNVLSTLDSDLRVRFGEQGQLGAAGRRLNEKFGGASGAKELLRRGVDWAKIDPHGKDRRLLAMVQEAWAPDDARKEQARCLDTVAEQMRAVVTAGAEDLSAEIFRSLITLDRINPEDQNLFRAIRMLPMMALETRAFAITYADASGSVSVPEGRPLRQGVEMLDEDRRTMLAGAAVLLGADFGADADLDAPAAIASAITSLLTGGGGASGASAVAPALVGTVAVGLTAAVVVQAGNRAMKERNRIGHSLLKAHQLATVEHIRNSVVELMRLTREVLASRLHYALRLDDAQIRQFALLQAIRDTERARGRMLEVLGGRHVA